MDHEQRGTGSCHNSKPNQFGLAPPRRFVNMRNRRSPHNLGNILVAWLDGVGDSVNDFLYPALADGQAEDGQEVVLHSAAAVPMDAAKLGDVGRKPGSKARAFLWRDQSLDHSAAPRATALVKDDVFHIEPGLGNLDVLMDVVGLGINQVGAAACTRTGMKFRDFRGPQTLLADTDAFFAGFGFVGLLTYLEKDLRF